MLVSIQIVVFMKRFVFFLNRLGSDTLNKSTCEGVNSSEEENFLGLESIFAPLR